MGINISFGKVKLTAGKYIRTHNFTCGQIGSASYKSELAADRECQRSGKSSFADTVPGSHNNRSRGIILINKFYAVFIDLFSVIGNPTKHTQGPIFNRIINTEEG